MFTDEDFDKLEYEKWITKTDRLRGRKVSYKFSPYSGHHLRIEGRGVMGNGRFTVQFDVNDIAEVNCLAEVLVKAKYPAPVPA